MKKSASAWENAYKERGVRWRKGSEIPGTQSHGMILELGCGNGKTMSALLSKGAIAAGMDISKTAVRLCKASCKGALLLVMDCENLAFRDNCFDSVFCFHCLSHIPKEKRKRAAAEASRVLSKGGRLFFSDFSRGDMRCGTGKPCKESFTFERNGIETHYFTKKEAMLLFPDILSGNAKEIAWRHGKGIPERKIIEAEIIKNPG